MQVHTVEDLRQICPKWSGCIAVWCWNAQSQGVLPGIAGRRATEPANGVVEALWPAGLDVRRTGRSVGKRMSRAAEKLRTPDSVTGAVQVFVTMNVFLLADPKYSNGIVIALPLPTNDTCQLVRAALDGMKHICKPSYAEKKGGVMRTDLSPQHPRQSLLFGQMGMSFAIPMR
jgi:hypothetical protein